MEARNIWRHHRRSSGRKIPSFKNSVHILFPVYVVYWITRAIIRSGMLPSHGSPPPPSDPRNTQQRRCYRIGDSYCVPIYLNPTPSSSQGGQSSRLCVQQSYYGCYRYFLVDIIILAVDAVTAKDNNVSKLKRALKVQRWDWKSSFRLNGLNI